MRANMIMMDVKSIWKFNTCIEFYWEKVDKVLFIM